MGCAKDDGFVPFDLFYERTAGMGSPKEGDTVRLKDGIVKRVHDRSGLFDIEFGKVVTPVHIGAIAAVRRKPREPLKVGDVVRHPEWHDETAEIAGIRDGWAVFWPASGRLAPEICRISELERVRDECVDAPVGPSPPLQR